MAIKNHDFVEIEYSGKIGGVVFDTTIEEVAKKSDLYNEGMKYSPIIICVGESHILKGLDKSLIGREPGESYSVKLAPEDAFGKKSGKLLKLIPLSMFRKQKIQAAPGLQVNIDGMVGVVMRVSGGRVIVDFNHPLAGKQVVYEVKINSVVTDKVKQIQGLMKILVNQDVTVVLKEDSAEVTITQELPPDIKRRLEEKIVELVKVKTVIFKLQIATEEEKKG